jgi:hypothetical protein
MSKHAKIILMKRKYTQKSENYKWSRYQTIKAKPKRKKEKAKKNEQQQNGSKVCKIPISRLK